MGYAADFTVKIAETTPEIVQAFREFVFSEFDTMDLVRSNITKHESFYHFTCANTSRVAIEEAFVPFATQYNILIDILYRGEQASETILTVAPKRLQNRSE